jgi:hypothetical protein
MKKNDYGWIPFNMDENEWSWMTENDISYIFLVKFEIINIWLMTYVGIGCYMSSMTKGFVKPSKMWHSNFKYAWNLTLLKKKMVPKHFLGTIGHF